MQKSIVRSKIAAGRPVLVAKSNFRSPEIAEMTGLLGYDCLWICNEHLYYDDSQLDHIVRAARVTGMDTLLRRNISGYERALIPLESGVNGLMIPRVRTVEYVRRVVEYVKFPPLGRRGIDGVNADADFGLVELDEYLTRANERTFLVIQIEDPEAVEIIDDLAAIDGVDVLFVGPADLSLGYGAPGQLRHPRVEKAIDLVADACARHGKAAGTPAIDAEDTRRLLDRGYRFFTTSADYRFVRNGLLETRSAFSELGFAFRDTNG